MSPKDKQKIVIFLTLEETDRNLILWGIKIASLFRKELCLVSFLGKGTNKEQSNAILAKYMGVVNNELPELPISSLLLESSAGKAPLLLADNYEAILMVAPASQFKKHQRGLTSSPIPFLFTGNNLPEVNRIEKIVVPVDLRKENNDSGIWASYFGRFHKSEVLMLAANDKNSQNRKLVTANIAFISTLLKKFSIVQKVLRGEKGSFGIQFEALDLAKKTGADLLITTGSSTITLLDLIIGLPEQKLIQNANGLPILIINPRRDMYVMCD
jgi:hypothetical protein